MTRMSFGKKRGVACIATVLVILVATVAVAFLPAFSSLRSMAVMSVYSAINKKNSIASEKNIKVSLWGGGFISEWYPFVMMYDASDEFSWRTGKDARVNIYYNFAAFDRKDGCSRLYDPDSDLYMGFYGAYFVSGTGAGFDETGVFQPGAMDDVTDVLKFDIFELVLDDFGLIDPGQRIFEYTITKTESIHTYAGIETWVCLDADLWMNGPAHTVNGFVRSYLQYGQPRGDIAKRMGNDIEKNGQFSPVAMKGRLYGHYFAEEDTTVWFYLLCRNEEVLERTDETILQKSTLAIR